MGLKKTLNPFLGLLGYKITNARSVVIGDFTYTPKARQSFSTSPIAAIFKKDYTEKMEIYQNRVSTIAKYESFFKNIPLADPNDQITPCWNNKAIPHIDAAALYTFITERNPRYYVECGSGNTTKFVARAIRDHALRTEIISIDPCPRVEIDQLCSKIFRIPFEDMDMDFFKTLTEEDIFLADNSHRSFPNSDVTVFFTEVLPTLPSGMLYAIHDIALPYEVHTDLFYNEQYMLAVYILGGMMGDSIYFPTGFLGSCTNLLHNLNDELMSDHSLSLVATDGFFWAQKK